MGDIALRRYIFVFKLFKNMFNQSTNLKKYFKYAIGEIPLIALGILVAVQVSHWTGKRNQKLTRIEYTESLMSEIDADIAQLSFRDSMNLINKEKIIDYLSYFGSDSMDIQILINKFDSLDWTIGTFQPTTYTIQDLLSSGNISLFSNKERNLIIKLRNLQEITAGFEKVQMTALINDYNDRKKVLDLAYQQGYTESEHSDVKNWQKNVSSTQYRYYNNSFTILINLYDLQTDLYGGLIKQYDDLMEALTQY